MAIPDFQSLMLPFLRFVGDGEEHSVAESRKPLADELGLTEDDLRERLASGQSRYHNRLAWTKVHLERAGLLANTRRGFFRITDRGREVLATPPSRIDLRFLAQFPGFSEFRGRSSLGESPPGGAPDASDETTPEETLEAAYQQLRRGLASDLLSQIHAVSPSFFEGLVVDLMLKMGYGGTVEDLGSVTSAGADEGIDGVINEDRLGLDVIYLQAKRWEAPIGRPEVQKFVGALHGKRARKGVFITTSSFTRDAIQYVSTIDPKVVLIDGLKLAQFMIDFDVGVTPARSYPVKRIDGDYFLEE